MKPPAALFYFDDFLAGTMHFSDAETGLYIRLLCVQWNAGSIPDDDVELATYGKGGTPVARVKSKFVKGEDGRLRNERMEIERKKQEDYRASRSANGKHGGRPCKAHENHMVLKTKAQESFPIPIPIPYPTKEDPSASASPPLVLESQKHQSEKGSGREPVSQDPLDIPKELHSPEFTQSWQQWMTMRRGMGKKPKDWSLMFGEQLKWLKDFGAIEATEIIKQSLRNNYQGLFERKNGTHNKTHQRPNPRLEHVSRNPINDYVAGAKRKIERQDAERLAQQMAEAANGSPPKTA